MSVPSSPMWKERAPLAIFVCVTLAAVALGIRARLAADAHDVPVPASEARAEVVVRLDLSPRVGCDEAFDVALYGHPGVELITWDGQRRSCRGRRVVVKYLPGRIRRAALLERIEKNAASMKVDQ